MLKLSRKTMFAIEAVLDIAYHTSDQPVQSGEITTRQGIPRRYLEQVLQQLVRAKILAGVRGPRGGYRLAKERRRISVGEIVRAIHEEAQEAEGNFEAGTDRKISSAPIGSDLGEKIVKPMWVSTVANMIAHLDMITVQDLCTQATEAGIESDTANRLDYSI